MTLKAKKAIRTHMLARRNRLTAETLALHSAKIVKNLQRREELQNARNVALFWPMAKRNEVDLRSLDAALRLKGVKLFYPTMARNAAGDLQPGFRRVESPSCLVDRGSGFLEPAEKCRRAGLNEIDLTIVPALAFDPDGHRIGYGAGFYDLALKNRKPSTKAIIVAFEFQFVSTLPHESHDVTCDAIQTEQRYLVSKHTQDAP